MKHRLPICVLILWALTQAGCPRKIHYVAMRWDNDGADVYNIYRGTLPSQRLFLAATVGTGYTDYAVEAGTTYFYDVRGMNAAGEGEASNVVIAQVPK